MDLIGNTPLVKLRHLPDDNHADVFVKFEAANPTGSMAEAGVFPAMPRSSKSPIQI
jgi:cysteine synthase A